MLDSAEDLDTDIDEYASIRLAEALGLSIRLAEALGLLDSAEDVDTDID